MGLNNQVVWNLVMKPSDFVLMIMLQNQWSCYLTCNVLIYSIWPIYDSNSVHVTRGFTKSRLVLFAPRSYPTKTTLAITVWYATRAAALLTTLKARIYFVVGAHVANDVKEIMKSLICLSKFCLCPYAVWLLYSEQIFRVIWQLHLKLWLNEILRDFNVNRFQMHFLNPNAPSHIHRANYCNYFFLQNIHNEHQWRRYLKVICPCVFDAVAVK